MPFFSYPSAPCPVEVGCLHGAAARKVELHCFGGCGVVARRGSLVQVNELVLVLAAAPLARVQQTELQGAVSQGVYGAVHETRLH